MRISALALAMALTAPGLQAHAAEPPPAASYFGKPRFGTVKLSPNGRFLAVRAAIDGYRDGLIVVSLEDQAVQPVAQYQDLDIGRVEWVNDNRLVYDTQDPGAGRWANAPGLFAVDRDGAKHVQLVARGGDSAPTLQPANTYLLGQDGAQNDDSVYVVRPQRGKDGLESFTLLRLNTSTGSTASVAQPPSLVGVRLDAQGEPRVATSASGGRAAVHYREPATGEWRQLAEFPAAEGAPGAFAPLGAGGDGTLYVASAAGGDKLQVRSYSASAGELGKAPLVDLGEYDFDGELVYGGGKVVGLSYLTDARGTHWWDKGAAGLQAAVDKLLPGTINQLILPRRPETPLVLVASYADRQPPVYLLYNQVSKTVAKLGETHPDLPFRQMGQRTLVRYKARDGLSIPAWLTLPPGGAKSKLPMVVLVHGGPFLRGGEWHFEPESQFLAARGYAVLEPEFRGSTGYGARHFQAGWKQLGMAMQDDLADGVRALVANGTADAGRVCIVGAGVGGYAALMGLAKDGALYQCGAAWGAVPDPQLLFGARWQVQAEQPARWPRASLAQLLGDPVQDAARLKAASPLAVSGAIRQPVLLAYGGKDERVPLASGRQLHAALQGHNSQAELVVYPDERLDWTQPDNRIDFWNKVAQFLGKHIGRAAKTE